MGMQAIDQNIFPEVFGKTIVFYCLKSMTEGNFFDLLPALPLNNCFITKL